MANKKITELDAVTTLDNTDLIADVQDVSTTPVTKKVTWTVIKAFLKTYFDTLYQTVLGLTSNVSGTGFTLTGGATPKTLTVSNTANISGTNTGDQTLPVKATGAEIDTGTDDAKFATAKAIADSHNVPSVAPGTSGNVMTSNGTDWISSADMIKVVTVNVSSAEILSLFTTPIEIIPAPGANKFIRIIGGNIYNKFNTTAYASGGNLFMYYNNATLTPACSTPANIAFLNATGSTFAGVAITTSYYTVNAVNVPIFLKMITQNPTTGNGTLIISLAYIIENI